MQKPPNGPINFLGVAAIAMRVRLRPTHSIENIPTNRLKNAQRGIWEILSKGNPDANLRVGLEKTRRAIVEEVMKR